MSKQLLALFFLLVSIRSALAEDQRVGSFGDPQRWELRGLQSADPEKIRQGLRFDFAVSLAAHPQAPLADLPAVLQKRLLTGLQHIGFRDANVAVRVDRDRGIVELAVTEGPKFRSGNVIVTGIDGELADKIVTCLTEKTRDLRKATPKFDSGGNVVKWDDAGGQQPKEQDAIWYSDQPAPFDEMMHPQFKRRIEQTIEDAGYGPTKFDFSLVARGEVADLVIQVAELGALPVLRAIEIDGNLRDSDDEIIRFLGVQIGEQLTNQRKVQLQRALWESGRFAEQTVQSKTDTSGTTLQIKVVETMGAPRLSDPLPPQALALLKCRKWITEGEGRNRDYVITPSQAANEWEVIASGEGIIISLNDAAQTDGLPQFAAKFAREGVSCYEIRQHRKLQSLSSAQRLKFLAGMAANSNEQNRYRLTFGFEFKERGESNHEPPFQLKTMLDPSCFVALGGDPNVSGKWDQDLLTLKTAHGQIRLNSNTGEFLGYEGKYLIVQAVTNRFKARQEQLELATYNDPEQFDPARPVSCVVEFFATSTAVSTLCDLFEVSETKRNKVSAMQIVLKSLVDRDAFRRIDYKLVSRDAAKAKKEEVLFPTPSEHFQKVFGKLAIPFADELFERESWPWSVWREAGFTAAGQSPYTNAEMQQILRSGKMGPVGHCLLVGIFSHTGNELLAAKMAQNGLQTLNRFSFRADCDQLLSKSWPHVLTLVQSLETLSDSELDAIATVAAVDRDLLQQIRGTLKELSDADKPTALLAGLERLWANQWGQQIEAQLREAIAAKPATATTESAKTNR